MEVWELCWLEELLLQQLLMGLTSCPTVPTMSAMECPGCPMEDMLMAMASSSTENSGSMGSTGSSSTGNSGSMGCSRSGSDWRCGVCQMLSVKSGWWIWSIIIHAYAQRTMLASYLLGSDYIVFWHCEKMKFVLWLWYLLVHSSWALSYRGSSLGHHCGVTPFVLLQPN